MRSEKEIRQKLKAIQDEMAYDKHTRTWEVRGRAWVEFAKWVLNDSTSTEMTPGDKSG